MNKKKILMTYIESGFGHITSITSISDSMKKYYGDKFDIIDCYIMDEDNDHVLKTWERFVTKMTQSTNKNPGFGGVIFAFLNIMGGVHFMRGLHRTIFSNFTNHCIEAFKKRKPDIIVSTHYFITFAALEYRKKVDPNCKVITYNPDNNIHVWWDNREHLFLVNNHSAYLEAVGKRKFNPSCVKEVGFIAREEILQANLSRDEYRKKLNIPLDKFCVIVADGAYAMGKLKKVVKQLLKIDKPITIIALAGKNEKLKQQFEKLKATNKIKSNIDFIILPFTTNIHEYYKAANVFITKAGPNATLDSTYMGTPVLIDFYAHPIEKATTKLFVEQFKVGKYIPNPKKIKKQIESWIDDETELKEFELNAKKVDKNQNGGEICAKYIFEEANRKSITQYSDYDNNLYMLANEGKFDTYTTPINYNNQAKDIDYNKIIHLNFFEKIYKGFLKCILWLFRPLINFFGFWLKVKGRKNLKHIKNAITFSNHTHYLDCLWCMAAIRGHKLMLTGAAHNNKLGAFGKFIRIGGNFIPLPETITQTREFEKTAGKLLKQKSFIHFYSEQAMWLYYTQSRPLKRGAFYYASKFNVPVIPMIALFKKTKFRKKVILQICEPIYPQPNLSQKENSEYMQSKAQEIYNKTIIDFYGYDAETYDMTKINLPKNKK